MLEHVLKKTQSTAWMGGVKVQNVARKGWAKEENERRHKRCARRHMERGRIKRSYQQWWKEREKDGLSWQVGRKGRESCSESNT